MKNRQKMLDQLNGDNDDNEFDNKMDDTNFDAMEWDQKENAPVEPEQSLRKSNEEKKDENFGEKRVSVTVDQA